MNSKLKKHLRLASFSLLALSGIFSSSTLNAMSAGNPAYPVIPGINPEQKGMCAFEICNSYNLFAALTGSLKIGFSGDYIFSESARVKDVPVVTSVNTSGTGPKPTITSTVKNFDFDLNDSQVSSSCVFASVAIQDTSPAAIPLLDVSFDVKIGGLKQYYRLPLNAYRDFTSSPLASESQVTDGLVEVQSNYGFVWDLSLKKILWKDGVSFIGIGGDYRHAACPVNYIIVNSQANPEVYFEDSNGKISYKEWSANIGITTYINDYILPYVSVAIGSASRTAPADSFQRLESQFSNLKFKVRKITNFHRVNFCCGATSCAADNFFYSVEGRWGCQRAINVTAGFQF
ncbi:outer membrane protein ompB [Chlamydia felis Fe/C-56]|uniref:Outer membrane protein ompB n=1 Tax=Chlamydia felis (strain Fe/C-56) TaxID=264202 RepID=Q256B5_CHLFF|nr:membrane protein [Chlamydia felis]BAE80873.1 outer membrane protein ompB [Chlamydia felis Fe/C-56]